jgi:hypothetical protein
MADMKASDHSITTTVVVGAMVAVSSKVPDRPRKLSDIGNEHYNTVR